MQAPFTIVGPPAPAHGLVITCEHAANALPAHLVATAADARWLDTHWGWDPGAAEIARGLSAELGATAVFAAFSRLVCDPNRDPHDPTWARALVREDGEEHALSFNARLDAAERDRRLALWEAYHDAIDRALLARRAAGQAPRLFSVHTFTPRFDGAIRRMEVGVLFDREEREAAQLAEILQAAGFSVALNEPYSGRAGLMYAVDRHARVHNIPCLELEVRQDLAGRAEARDALVAALSRALFKLGWTPRERPITYPALPD